MFSQVRCLNLAQYMTVAERVKEFFHNEGIHSTTIQVSNSLNRLNILKLSMMLLETGTPLKFLQLNILYYVVAKEFLLSVLSLRREF